MKYTYTQDKKEGILKLCFSGDLIGEHSGPKLVELCNGFMSEGIIYCFIDISLVRYINSSGIGVLITLLTKFRSKKGKMFLINPSEHVNKLLMVTKLKTIFDVTINEEEALNKINNYVKN